MIRKVQKQDLLIHLQKIVNSYNIPRQYGFYQRSLEELCIVNNKELRIWFLPFLKDRLGYTLHTLLLYFKILNNKYKEIYS